MLAFVECRGFFGSAVAGYVLNLPLTLKYTPILAVSGLYNAPAVLLHPWYFLHLAWWALGLSFRRSPGLAISL